MAAGAGAAQEGSAFAATDLTTPIAFAVVPANHARTASSPTIAGKRALSAILRINDSVIRDNKEF